MKREDFLNQLEYLLQDVSEEEKRDAIDYYRDYLEEAGPEREEEVFNGFGSPERIAAIIRTDLLGGMEDGVEFTDKGYEDQRFATSSLPATRREEIIEQKNSPGNGESGKRESRYKSGSYAEQKREDKSGRNGRQGRGRGWFYYLMMSILIIISVPIIITAAAAVFSGAIGIGSVLLVLLIVLAVLTMVGFVTGAALIIFGVTGLLLDGWFGVMCIGAGLAFAGIGCILLVCSILFYGKFIPWFVRAVADLFGRLFGKRRKKKDDIANDSDGGAA